MIGLSTIRVAVWNRENPLPVSGYQAAGAEPDIIGIMSERMRGRVMAYRNIGGRRYWDLDRLTRYAVSDFMYPPHLRVMPDPGYPSFSLGQLFSGNCMSSFWEDHQCEMYTECSGVRVSDHVAVSRVCNPSDIGRFRNMVDVDVVMTDGSRRVACRETRAAADAGHIPIMSDADIMSLVTGARRNGVSPLQEFYYRLMPYNKFLMAYD